MIVITLESRPLWQRILRALLLRLHLVAAPPAPSPPARARVPVEQLIPAALRVERAVLAQRAMVQAANTLATAGEDLPSFVTLSLHYPDDSSVQLHMSLHGPGDEDDEEVLDDDA